MNWGSLSYKTLLVDRHAIPALKHEGLVPEIREFCKIGRICTVGAPGEFSELVHASKGMSIDPDVFDLRPLPSGLSTRDSARQEGRRWQLLAEQLGIAPQAMRRTVLYLKAANGRAILIDWLDSNRSLPVDDYIRLKSCHLRLVADTMETCPYSCLYCFADYSWMSPTTVVFDAPEQLAVDIASMSLRPLMNAGYPVYLGSLGDLCSPVARELRVLQRSLHALKGERVFIATKSPGVSDRALVDLLVNHGHAKIAFTFTNLPALEPFLPYDSRSFPAAQLARLVEAGLDVTLLYKPIIPDINDKPKAIWDTLAAAFQIGIRELTIGFIQMDQSLQQILEVRAPKLCEALLRKLTDTIDNKRIPSPEYRLELCSYFRHACDALGLRLSFCQAFLGSHEDELANSLCVCRPERWES